MKKIIISMMAVAALAACTKSEVAYEAPAEIGFNVVAGNLTKAVVDGDVYPTDLNMYVYAQTTDNTTETANYINNGEFSHDSKIGEINVWGGITPYYWPNVKTLHFAGYSKSGNVNNGATVSYICNTNPETLAITNYSPGTATAEGANDLMWFPTTELLTPGGYGKATAYVPVNMYHTCAWITFLVKGDEVTSNEDNPYTITSMQMTGIDQTADVTCSATVSEGTVTPSIIWSENTDKTENYDVTLAGHIALTTAAKNVETNAEYPTTGNTEGNIVVIPQVPGKLNLTYTFKSSTNAIITETATGLELKVAEDDANVWEPGKHYIYTITIKANEILVAPTPIDWTDSNHNVTVE